jgi:hypothetical protein
MKSWFTIFALFFCLACAAAEKPRPAISKHDREAAEKQFKDALEFQKKGKAEEALLAATRATQLFPGNVEYLTMAEMLRQQIVGAHLEEGNRLAEIGDTRAAGTGGGGRQPDRQSHGCQTRTADRCEGI